MCQTQILNQLLDPLLLLSLRHIQSKSSCETQRLLHREVSKYYIILHHVGAKVAEAFYCDWCFIVQSARPSKSHTWLHSDPIAQ